MARQFSSGSSICPDHAANKSYPRNNTFGSKHMMVTRKVTLDKLLKLDGDEKAAFVNETRTIVERLRNVGIKTQMFDRCYFLRQLEYDNPPSHITTAPAPAPAPTPAPQDAATDAGPSRYAAVTKRVNEFVAKIAPVAEPSEYGLLFGSEALSTFDASRVGGSASNAVDEEAYHSFDYDLLFRALHILVFGNPSNRCSSISNRTASHRTTPFTTQTTCPSTQV